MAVGTTFNRTSLSAVGVRQINWAIACWEIRSPMSEKLNIYNNLLLRPFAYLFLILTKIFADVTPDMQK
jgi:hypothetical protein